MNSSYNVSSEMSVNGNIGSVEDCDCVEDDSVDSGPLLKDHDNKTQDKWMPYLFGLQLSKEGKWSARKMFTVSLKSRVCELGSEF